MVLTKVHFPRVVLDHFAAAGAHGGSEEFPRASPSVATTMPTFASFARHPLNRVRQFIAKIHLRHWLEPPSD